MLGWLAVAALGPLALEWAGVFAGTWRMVDGGVRSTSAIFDGSQTRDAAVLVIANFVLLGAVGMYALDINRRVRVASEKLFVQAWHLRQLLPGGGAAAS